MIQSSKSTLPWLKLTHPKTFECVIRHNHSYYQTWLWKKFLSNECQSMRGGEGTKKGNFQSHVQLEEKVRTWFLEHPTCLFACRMEAVKKAIAAASPFSIPSLWVYHIEITDHCATQDQKLSL